MGVLKGLCGAAGVISLAFFLLGPTLAYARMLPGQTAFLVCALGMLLGVVSAIGGFIIGARSGFGASAWLGLLGAAPALFLVYSVVNTRGLPLINDISTDVVYPPQFEHAQTLPENNGRDMAFPEGFKDQVREGYPDLQSLAMSEGVDDVFAKAHDLARARENWEITATRISDKESLFEGYATTRVFGFVDDFVVRVTNVDDGGCVVDMRSKSRDGKGDLGANAARIDAFFDHLRSSS